MAFSLIIIHLELRAALLISLEKCLIFGSLTPEYPHYSVQPAISQITVVIVLEMYSTVLFILWKLTPSTFIHKHCFVLINDNILRSPEATLQKAMQ